MSSNKKQALCLQRAGQEFHQKKNYAAAIAEFTKALELPNVPFSVQTGILGRRAAARERIGGTANLELALLDSRRMIRQSKGQGRVYTHAGRICQRLGRDESAMDIYANGIKQLEPGHPKLKALRKALKIVQDRVALRGEGVKDPPAMTEAEARAELGEVEDRVELGEVRDTRCDPLSYLPVELAESILQYLPFRGWRDVPESSLQAYISRSGGNVRKAVLFGCIGDSALSTLVHQSPQLSVLGIRHSQITSEVLLKETHILRNLTALITDLWFPMDGFRGILEGCASLRTFECSGIFRTSPIKAFTANLRRLKIWDESVILALPSPLEEPLLAIVKCLPKLEEIKIRDPYFSHLFFSPYADFKSLESLSVLALRRSRIREFPLLPKSVRVLDISENSMIQWSLQDLAASPLPNLESFAADYNPQINNAHVLAILAPSLKKRSLRSLSLCGCRGMDFDSLKWLMKHGKNLVRLEIGENSTITDKMSKEVAKFKKLRYLGLSYSEITGAGVMNVVNGLRGVLREIDISGCYYDMDVVQLDEGSELEITQRREPC